MLTANAVRMPSSRTLAACMMTLAATSDEGDSVVIPSMPDSSYFDEYASIYDHVGMLRDFQRMSAYHDAIKQNAAAHFRGKTVLDIGTGTGILAIWAAQAGARAVYAVEATGVARHAEAMVAAHGLKGTVTVLRGTMEEVSLPEHVDVIVSEWMGYFLLRESMVQSVLFARDRWLKPGGLMYPATARIMVHALEDADFVAARESETTTLMEEWAELAESLQDLYALDFSALTDAYAREHFEWLYRSGWQGGVPARVVRGEAQPLLEVDMSTVTFDELFNWSTTVNMPQASAATPLHGLCVWFDVNFCSAETQKHLLLRATVDGAGTAATEPDAASCVTLSTSPLEPQTHWGATALFLSPQLVSPTLAVGLTQSAANHHNLNVSLSYEGAPDQSGSASEPPVPTDAFYSISAEIKGYELMSDELGGGHDSRERSGGEEDDRYADEEGNEEEGYEGGWSGD